MIRPMLYLTPPTSYEFVHAALCDPDSHLGMMSTPDQGNRILRGVPCGYDNGAFGKGYPGDDAWWRWISSRPKECRPDALYATAPDVVHRDERGEVFSDFPATWARSRPYLQPLRDLGYPAALVAGDGMEGTGWQAWDEIDVLFIGGSTAWKLGNAAREIALEAAARGKWVHVGRVNSLKRCLHARHEMGASSVDGNIIRGWPSIRLPEVRSWVDYLAAADSTLLDGTAS